MVFDQKNDRNIIGRQDMEIYFSQENENEEFFSSFRAVCSLLFFYCYCSLRNKNIYSGKPFDDRKK